MVGKGRAEGGMSGGNHGGAGRKKRPGAPPTRKEKREAKARLAAMFPDAALSGFELRRQRNAKERDAGRMRGRGTSWVPLPGGATWSALDSEIRWNREHAISGEPTRISECVAQAQAQQEFDAQAAADALKQKAAAEAKQELEAQAAADAAKTKAEAQAAVDLAAKKERGSILAFFKPREV